ncbi:MAG: DUF2059 domain-containing protein [Candidatus Zapsychrus exili]|nr:DUF2059 domain-containing protein [Candidatus Zapsychrus exili]
MKKIIFVLIASFVFSFVCSVSIAETVYLNDGSVVKGEIIQKNSYYIIIKSGTVLKKYYLGQVNRIEEDQEPTQEMDISQFEDISANKIELILVLLQANGTKESLIQKVDSILLSAPAGKEEEFKNLFNVGEIMAQLIPIYDKYYLEEDLEKVVEFFQSQTGQAFLKATPSVVEETTVSMVEYFKSKLSLGAK